MVTSAARFRTRNKSNVSNSSQYAANRASTDPSGAPASGLDAHVAYVATTPNTAILYQPNRSATTSIDAAKGISASTANVVFAPSPSVANAMKYASPFTVWDRYFSECTIIPIATAS